MPSKEKRLKDAKAAAEEADFRVFQTHHGGVSRYRGLRFATPPATSHSLRSGIRPFRSCGGHRGIEGIQPERLNAEGEARVLLAGGGALAQPPGCLPPKEKRLKDAKAAAEEADFRVL